MRRNAPQIDRPSTSAASLELDRDRVELVAHDPDDDRQHHQRVEQDQADARVEQRQLLVEHEERHRQDDRRQDQLREEEERDVVVAHRPELVAEAAEPVGGERAERRPRAIEAPSEAMMLFVKRFEELVAHRRGLEDRVRRQAERAPALPVRAEVDPRDEMALRDVDRRLERGRDRPVDREQADERPEEQARRRSSTRLDTSSAPSAMPVLAELLRRGAYAASVAPQRAHRLTVATSRPAIGDAQKHASRRR